MRKKNFKRVAAFTLVTAMTCGSALTAFAAAGVAEGTGKYEGKDGEKPVISIDVPTEDELSGIYDYIADPNNLIGNVADNGSLGSSATIEGTNTGILFTTDANKYASTSKMVEVESPNLQDVDVTVELKVKEAGDAIIAYTDDPDFSDPTDNANKLYLAVTNADASEDAALSASGVVKLTQKVEGIADNYTLKYDTVNSKYVYEKNGGAGGWNKVGFALTGAINTNAEWGENVKFPKLQITWSYKEHKDAPTVTPGSLKVGVKSAVISGLEAGATLDKVELIKPDGSKIAMAKGTQYNYAANTGTFTILKDVLVGSTYVNGKYILTFGDVEVEIPVVAAD